MKQYLHYRSPEKEERKAESLFKGIMVVNFPNWGRYMDIQISDAHRFPHRFNPKRISPKHIILELSKIKENFENRKVISYSGNVMPSPLPLSHPIRL